MGDTFGTLRERTMNVNSIAQELERVTADLHQVNPNTNSV
jgi:hypothetical protein